MDDVEVVKMSDKGQLVVPQGIRNQSHLSPGERFIAFPVPDGVLFKKLELPKINFEELAKEITHQFKNKNVKAADVKEAVQWARKR